MIHPQTFNFLKDLSRNNNREWFTSKKKDYEQVKSGVLSILDELEEGLNHSDLIDKKKLFRINRDVRFSKDKSPYKQNFSGYFGRSGAGRRGSYYISLEPGNSMVGGGFYGPEKDDLLRIRKEFENDGKTIESIVNNKNFIKHFGTLNGAGVATAPRDFDKNHPNIKWIRMKQFYAFRNFSDKEVLSDSFVSEALSSFIAIRPFFDYMTHVLTTNLNGESII